MWIGITAGLASGAIWGLVFVAPRMLPQMSAIDIAAYRFICFGAWAFFLCLLKTVPLGQTRWPKRSHWGFIALMGVLGYTGYYFLLVLGIQDAGVEVPSLMTGTIPLWMMLLGKPAHLSWRSLFLGLLLTALGIALMGWESLAALQHQSNATSGHFWRGIAFTSIAVVSWTAFALLNARWLQTHSEVNASTWANWLGLAAGAGGLILLIFSHFSTSKPSISPVDHAGTALVLIATGIGSGWLGTILWNIASQRLPASLCGQLIVSETLFALLYAFCWDGQLPTTAQYAATALFTIGVIFSIRAHR